MKEQCDQAKSFWELWIGRQCGKCSRFHLTEDEIEILKEHKDNFEDVSLDLLQFIHHVALHSKNVLLADDFSIYEHPYQTALSKTENIHSQEHYSLESTSSSPSTSQTVPSTTRPAEYAPNGARCMRWPCLPWTSRRNTGVPQDKEGWRFGSTSARLSSWAWRWTILLRSSV